ncbi:MAG TPA: gamma-glutamylcyclotransferase [Jatrophihabitantaceae bacterium]
MFLNGTAMSGGADHHLVGAATLVGAVRTAARYRFHSVDDRYPALEDVGAGGASVEGELYEISYEQLRDVLLPGEPDGLELGVIELADGSGALAMVLRRPRPSLATTDISALGSWRAYRRAPS